MYHKIYDKKRITHIIVLLQGEIKKVPGLIVQSDSFN